ncbi:MAG TPA: hypothetical protein VIJ04_18940 [Xanthobacteraceae bacterium]
MLFDTLMPRRREQHGLASALIGEIVAAMEAVERSSAVQHLHPASTADDRLTLDFTDFALPRLAVYEANVGRLGLFNAPLPRELSYFYTRLNNLPQRLRALRTPPNSSPDEQKLRARIAIGEIDQTMTLGNDLLRSMKGFVSRKRHDSISRA